MSILISYESYGESTQCEEGARDVNNIWVLVVIFVETLFLNKNQVEHTCIDIEALWPDLLAPSCVFFLLLVLVVLRNLYRSLIFDPSQSWEKVLKLFSMLCQFSIRDFLADLNFRRKFLDHGKHFNRFSRWIWMWMSDGPIRVSRKLAWEDFRCRIHRFFVSNVLNSLVHYSHVQYRSILHFWNKEINVEIRSI